MELGNVFTKLTSKEKTKEQFLAIEINSESVTTAVWQVIDGKTEVVAIGTSEEWEGTKKHEDLLTAIDASLDKAMQDIETEPNKVMFGLQEAWVDGDSISKQYTKLLKEVCEKFEFKPIGFVVTTEAIVQLLKKQEGTPPTAILIRVNEAEIQVSLVNLGKIIGTHTVARSEDIGADVEEGLARFSIDDHLPSRMLLFNGALDEEKLKQDLLSYNWLEKLPFLHFPKVKVLERLVAIKAVAIAGGEEAAKALGFKIIEDDQQETLDKEEKEQKAEAQVKETIPAEEEKEEKTDEPKITTDLGFSDAEEIGFKTDSGIGRDPEEKKAVVLPTQLAKEEEIEKEEAFEEKAPEPKSYPKFPLKNFGSRIKTVFKKPVELLADLSDRLKTRAKWTVIITVSLLFLIIGAAVYAYWEIPKAELELFINPRTLEKELTVIINPSQSEVNLEENIIPGKIVETEIEGTKEIETTGTKRVGERARGEALIYNKTSAVKTFSSGTVLIGPNNLRFTLDESVTIASASARETDETLTTTYGKANVPVTAADIGAEYNLDDGSAFTIESFSQSSYDAKNTSVFEGGSSREVSAVSEDDLDKVVSELTDELRKQAADKLKQEEGGGYQVLSQGSQVEVLSQDISGEAGEEAQTIKASLKLKVQSLAYQEAHLQQLIDYSVAESIPENLKLAKAESKVEIRSLEFEDEQANLEFIYQAVLIPEIDSQEIKNNLAGKYPGLAQEYLESLPNFSQAKVEITPAALPARLKTFPRKPENISIKVVVEKE